MTIRETVLLDVPFYEDMCRDILAREQRTLPKLRNVLARADLDGLTSEQRDVISIGIRKSGHIVALALRALAPSGDPDQKGEQLLEFFELLASLIQQECTQLRGS